MNFYISYCGTRKDNKRGNSEGKLDYKVIDSREGVIDTKYGQKIRDNENLTSSCLFLTGGGMSLVELAEKLSLVSRTL